MKARQTGYSEITGQVPVTLHAEGGPHAGSEI